MKALFLIIWIFSSTALFSSETDNFTPHFINIENSTVWLNVKMNNELEKIGNETTSCNVYSLQKKLFNSLGGVFIAKIENWSSENPNTYFLPIENSIYSNISGAKGLKGVRKIFNFKTYYTQGIMKVNDSIIGEDKLGHFLQVGYSMYYAVKMKQNPHYKDIRKTSEKLAEVLAKDYKYLRHLDSVDPLEIISQFSHFQENNEWGLKATLVKSYADIAANYYGYLFWNELVDGKTPYFTCVDNHFIKTRQFDFNEYINPSWDESINCSEFHRKIQNEMSNTEVKNCPIRPETCTELVKTIGPMAKNILHPKCLSLGSTL